MEFLGTLWPGDAIRLSFKPEQISISFFISTEFSFCSHATFLHGSFKLSHWLLLQSFSISDLLVSTSFSEKQKKLFFIVSFVFFFKSLCRMYYLIVFIIRDIFQIVLPNLPPTSNRWTSKVGFIVQAFRFHNRPFNCENIFLKKHFERLLDRLWKPLRNYAPPQGRVLRLKAFPTLCNEAALLPWLQTKLNAV